MRDGLEAATLRALGFDAAIAPIVARGAGVATGGDAWLCADPVVLVAGHEDVRLTARVDDLTPEESSAIRARLDRHFAADGVAFETPRPDRWLARVRDRPVPQTTPLAIARGAPLRPLLPQGPDARDWRRFGDEIQMLLHDDPVNDAREARGAQRVCGLWFWGGGRAPGDRPRAPLQVAVADGRDADLLRGLAAVSGSDASPLPPALTPEWMEGAPVLLLHAPADAAALDALARDFLAPAYEALADGAVRALRVVADAGGAAAIYRVARPSLLARLRDRLIAPAFALPSGFATS